MSIERLLGFSAGIIISLLLTAALILVTRGKMGKGICEYDERQELVRGRGFKYAFFTLMIYEFMTGLMEKLLEIRWWDTLTGNIMGIVLAISIFAVYCIWNDAYISLGEQLKRLYFLLGIGGLLNLIVAFSNLHCEGAETEGGLGIWIVNLAIGLMSLLLCVILFIRDRFRHQAE